MYGKGWGRGRGRGWRPVFEETDKDTVLLLMLPAGTKAKVANITAPPPAHQRLIAMGIVPGAEIEVLKNNHLEYGWGPIIVRINGIDLVLGRRIASFVYVKKLTEEQET